MDAEFDIFDEFLAENRANCCDFDRSAAVEPFYNPNTEYDEEFLRSLNDDLLVFLPQSMKNDSRQAEQSKEAMDSDEWPNVDKLLQCGMYS